MKKKLICTTLLAALVSGCAGFDMEALGVDETDNAIQCIGVTVQRSGVATGAVVTTTTRRVEFPARIEATADEMTSALESCP